MEKRRNWNKDARVTVGGAIRSFNRDDITYTFLSSI